VLAGWRSAPLDALRGFCSSDGICAGNARFAAAGIPFLRLRPVGSASENTIRAQVAEHVEELVRSLRSDLPGYDQARGLLEDLSGIRL